MLFCYKKSLFSIIIPKNDENFHRNVSTDAGGSSQSDLQADGGNSGIGAEVVHVAEKGGLY